MRKKQDIGIGHNSDNATKARLKSIVERIERLEEERSGLAEDIKEIYGEAKATGFDVKVIRQIIRLRKIDVDKRREQEMLLETYMCSLGMLSDTPLGQAAIAARG